jgi:hypothetical protein
MLWSTAVSGPQTDLGFGEPRSIIYAVILHEVCSALFSKLAASGTAERSPTALGEAAALALLTEEAGCPIKLQALRP